MRILGTPTFGGLLVALVFWWQSLTPTLIPRSALTQAAVTGVCAAIGYGIGTVAGRSIARFVSARRWPPGPGAQRLAWIVLGAGWPVLVALGSVSWVSWQNRQRDLMGMPSVGWTDAALMAALALAAGVVFVLIGRAMVRGVAALHRIAGRHLPASLAAPATILLLVLVVGVLGGGAAWRGLTAVVSSTAGATDDATDEGIEIPELPTVSGSSGSLVSWDALGRHGRTFVATATTAEELAAFHGSDAELSDPVRVYVGLASAGSPEERADLAVRELQRTGGFDRAVLAVWVPTGTGWMIAEAAAALEHLHRGDTAIVSIQYSFLPSLFAVFMDDGAAEEAGAVLFNAVHEHWSTLPLDERPELVLFGKSLGTAGVEASLAGPDAVSSVANLVARTDGALIVGAKKINPILSQVTQERRPDSPVWQPVFDDGRTVRFVTRDRSQPPLDDEWRAPRIVYLQHPSDPVPYWGLEALWWPPEWFDRPRGYDVPDEASWFPIVSGVQAAADLVFQLSTPPGFGHVYSTDYADGWARVVPPPGWTDADSDRLEAFIAETVTGGEEADQ
jgi:uncharacterized membrane protein